MILENAYLEMQRGIYKYVTKQKREVDCVATFPEVEGT